MPVPSPPPFPTPSLLSPLSLPSKSSSEDHRKYPFTVRGSKEPSEITDVIRIKLDPENKVDVVNFNSGSGGSILMGIIYTADKHILAR